jgi:hypothetical protein
MIEQHPPRETLQVTENIGAKRIWFWRLACSFRPRIFSCPGPEEATVARRRTDPMSRLGAGAKEESHDEWESDP